MGNERSARNSHRITRRIGHEIIQHSFDSIGHLICRLEYSVAILVQAWPFLAFSLVAAMTDADEYAQLIALVQDTVESAMADVLSKLQTIILNILSNETAMRSRVLIAWQAAHDARMAHAEANLKRLSDDLTARVELMGLYASSDSARLANAETNLKLLSDDLNTRVERMESASNACSHGPRLATAELNLKFLFERMQIAPLQFKSGPINAAFDAPWTVALRRKHSRQSSAASVGFVPQCAFGSADAIIEAPGTMEFEE